MFGGVLGKILQKHIRDDILQTYKFDIDRIAPSEAVKQIKVPAIFIHGISDEIVDISHTMKIVEVFFWKRN